MREIGQNKYGGKKTLQKINFLGTAAIMMMLAPAAAVASTTFVYDLTSDGSHNGGTDPALTGSITFDGNIGDAVPQLGAAGVTSFQFTVDGDATWNNTDSTFPADSMGFNGTLGSATLNGTSGNWQIEDPPESNADLYLWGQPNSNQFDELWGWCVPGVQYDCGDLGYSWGLTLASETSDAPEPATGGLVLGALAVFCAGRGLRKKALDA